MRSRRARIAAIPAAFATLVFASCTDLPQPTAPQQSAQCVVESGSFLPAPDEPPLDTLFAAAGAEFGVPTALLKAIGYVETRWQMVEGDPEFPGQPVAYGIMALKDEQLEQGARIAGLSADRARTEPGANIRAAAALLRSYADELGIAGERLEDWAPVAGRYSRVTLPEGRTSYLRDGVYATLREGAFRLNASRQPVVSLAPVEIRTLEAAPAPGTSAASSADHAPAVWRSSPNFNARPPGDGGRVAMVIIHTCEGSYAGCWSWLASPDSRVSAHYVVREDGQEITQLVRDASRAWHIGSSYDCALNAGHECWRNGRSNNDFTIGIEHAGYASQRLWPLAQLDASARLVCDLARRHGIARDGLRILGHAQLQPHNRTDPGRKWPWAEFYARIDAHCGDLAGEIVIDAAGRGTQATSGYSSVPDGWVATRQTAGFYGDGYFFAATAGGAGPAAFHFFLAEPGHRTIDAWWTAGSNRSPAAVFIAADASGRQLGSAHANQQRDGRRWNTLGTWSFSAGWNTIQVSREGPSGCVVIADAIRVRE